MQNGVGYDTVIFDLDGTLFRGRTVIPGAIDALQQLAKYTSCRFLSNNGERASSALAERLCDFGFSVNTEDIVSSADLVLKYTEELDRSVRILTLSSPQLASALASEGHALVEDASADLV
ncbi:hypothetical protein KAR02_09640, partial [Candidatus Bipolaricaulota bacterium]|nr:hypothetical protein [Candidatus Bipolaricaulota bacterium]